MDYISLTILRGKLDAVERGFIVDVLSAEDVRKEAQQMLVDYPDMQKDERSRVDALLMAGEPTRGMVC